MEGSRCINKTVEARGSRRQAWITAAIMAAAVLLPSWPLFPMRGLLRGDWGIHARVAGYCGAVLARHGELPDALNYPDTGGLPVPMLYGHLFYPLLAPLAAVINPMDVMRLVCVALSAAQLLLVRRALRRLGADNTLATAAACLVIWTVYPLTNLYCRGAVTEFVAVGLLTCALCYWFEALTAETAGELVRKMLAFGLCCTIAAGSHPISALYGVPLLAMLLITLPFYRGRVSWARFAGLLVGVAALGVAVLAPWVYASALFASDLAIRLKPGQVYHIPAFDRWLVRLWPIPFDPRVARMDLATNGSPFLDLQINMPLLALAGVAVWRYLARTETGRRRWLLAALVGVPAAYGVACLTASIKADVFRHLPAVFTVVQFQYRLISFVNLSLLLVLLVLGLYAHRNRGAGPVLAVNPLVACFALTLSGAGAVVVMCHLPVWQLTDGRPKPPEAVYVVWECAPDPQPVQENFLTDRAARVAQMRQPLGQCLPGFQTPFRFPLLNALERSIAFRSDLPAPDGGTLGRYGALTLLRNTPGYLVTQVIAFPWNRFFIDGAQVDPALLRTDGQLLAVPVPPAAHRVEYRFEPDRVYRTLRFVSRLTLVLWGVGLVAAWLATRMRGAFGRLFKVERGAVARIGSRLVLWAPTGLLAPSPPPLSSSPRTSPG